MRGLIADLEARGEQLPIHRGALHLAKVCETLGLNRSVLNDNPAFQQVLREYASAIGVRYSARETSNDGPGSTSDGSAEADSARIIKRLESRISRLETRNAVLAAENARLRMQVRENRLCLNEQVTTGRRFQPGPVTAPMLFETETAEP